MTMSAKSTPRRAVTGPAGCIQRSGFGANSTGPRAPAGVAGPRSCASDSAAGSKKWVSKAASPRAARTPRALRVSSMGVPRLSAPERSRNREPNRVAWARSLPPEASHLPGVRDARREDGDEDEHVEKCLEPQVREDHGPGVHEDHLHVERQEDEGVDGEPEAIGSPGGRDLDDGQVGAVEAGDEEREACPDQGQEADQGVVVDDHSAAPDCGFSGPVSWSACAFFSSGPPVRSPRRRAKDSISMNMFVTAGYSSRTRFSMRSTESCRSSAVRFSKNWRSIVTRMSSGPTCIVRIFVACSTAGSSVAIASTRLTMPSSALSPTRRPLLSQASHKATPQRIAPMTMEAPASKAGWSRAPAR